MKIGRLKRFIKNKASRALFSLNKLLPAIWVKSSKNSFSQCGEDLLISFVLMQLKIDKISYVDIGAHHPRYINNTYLFYKRGATGINIEPDPFLFKAFLKVRPKDINLNIGINDKLSLSVQKDDFYIMSERTLNTFSEKEAREIEETSNYKIEKVTKIESHDINSILEKYLNKRDLDLLSIDTEGLDFQILKAFNFENYAPKILCVETLTFSASGDSIKRGYFVYADTYINTIFVNKDVWLAR